MYQTVNKSILSTGFEKIYSITEASEYLGLKVSRLRYAVKKNQIPYIKIGRLLRFEKSQLDSWLQSLTRYPTMTPRQLARDLAEIRRKIRRLKEARF